MTFEGSFYEILEVREDDDVYTIRMAWRRLVQIYHPEVPTTGSKEKFEQINLAWMTLCDQKTRAEYDRIRDLQRKARDS